MTVLLEPLLAPLPHGFALRGGAPEGLARPRQVHGIAVAEARDCLDPGGAPAADTVVSTTPGLPVGVVTADCVPVLLASPGGAAVAAIHAGWRGLAQGVIEAGVAALSRRAEVDPSRLVAGIGPHVGPCCYEVDEPVLDELARGAAEAVDAAQRACRPGHAMLDLGALARAALSRAGLGAAAVGGAAVACTCCDARGFPSYRRDGPSAGRLVHFIAACAAEG